MRAILVSVLIFIFFSTAKADEWFCAQADHTNEGKPVISRYKVDGNDLVWIDSPAHAFDSSLTNKEIDDWSNYKIIKNDDYNIIAISPMSEEMQAGLDFIEINKKTGDFSEGSFYTHENHTEHKGRCEKFR